jgi:pimeloyl-ACP methyl ester carboxylesterase
MNIYNSIGKDLEQWEKEEFALGVPKKDQKRILWSRKKGESTSIIAIFIHGLYNSPSAFSSFEPLFIKNSINVLSIRLKGHRESNQNIMKREIEWPIWKQQIEADFLLAKKLGQKIIFVGHSTGALFSAWIAAQYPDDVAGLILFSPAFGIHPYAQLGAHFGEWTQLYPINAEGKLLSGHAALQVIKATKSFKEWQRKLAKEDSEYLAKRLSTIPIWMGNTKNYVIKKSNASQFMKSVKKYNPNVKVRNDFWIPYYKFVLHDEITTKKNPVLPQIKESIFEFLNEVKSHF